MDREVWITGCGLVSALGIGGEAHWSALSRPDRPLCWVDSRGFPPFHVHPIGALDLDRYIPRKGDQRAMGPLMHYGAYAAGMALEQAGVAGDKALLDRMHLMVASGGGERDEALDEQILEGLRREPDDAARLNRQLADGLRPTLFLAQLPNLFAGNISLVHGVVGSSRTFMGEESAGVDAVRIAFERIAAGQGELFLAGAAFNACRRDLQLIYHSGGILLTGSFRDVWSRPQAGICLGSVGAFLVIEARAHAEGRGARALARLTAVESARGDRSPGAASRNAEAQWRRVQPRLGPGPLAVMSGTCGMAGIATEERRFLRDCVGAGRRLFVRGSGTAIGHSMEACFPANLILAVCCLERRAVFPPLAPEEPLEAEGAAEGIDQALVTCWGHRRGEGMAYLEVAR